MPVTAEQVKKLAAECGFELAGVTSATPSSDYGRFEAWRQNGLAGEMTYLTDHRGDLRCDPRALLPEARTVVCVGKLYNSPGSPRTEPDRGRISRYAWGSTDYHEIVRGGLIELASRIASVHSASLVWRACVDTAPLLERSYAHAAGLGWIGKNTCLINQASGSWFFLGELLLSIPMALDEPAAFRCGTCSRCIDACPTNAIVPASHHGWSIDSNLCISYLTIEKRGPISAELAALMDNHIFGCDICQDVCPWNQRAPFSTEEQFAERPLNLDLAKLADLTREDFAAIFRTSPVWRAKYEGFLRNVAVALGNRSRLLNADPLEKLAAHPNPVVATAAAEALDRLHRKFYAKLTP